MGNFSGRPSEQRHLRDEAPKAGPVFRAIGATTYLSPMPAVLIGCADRVEGARPNLITVAWTGICCSHPPMLSISLRKERHSYALIERSREFTVNLVGEPLLRAMDFCGVKSGRGVDKFEALGLTAIPAAPLTHAPALAESPAYLCCRVQEILPLGSHDLFLAEIAQVCVQERYFTETGAINEKQMQLVGYVHGKYRALADEIGFFGFSVAREAVLKQRQGPSPNQGKAPVLHRAGEAEKVKTKK